MSSYSEEHIDALIRQVLQDRMEDAGEPRTDVLWTRIEEDIAESEKAKRHSLFSRFSLPRWHFVGAAALVACLAIIPVLFPGQLTALGKRVFFTAQVVEQTEDGKANIATGRYLQEDAPRLSAPDAPPGMGGGEFMPEDLESDTVRSTTNDTVVPEAEPDAQLEMAEPRIFAASMPQLQEELTLDEARSAAPFPVRYPAYVPEGFREDGLSYQAFSEQNGEVMIVFVDEHDELGVIRFTQQNLVGSYASGQGYDPARTTMQKVKIDGEEATLLNTVSEQGEWSDLTWFADDMVYRLSGPLDQAQIKEIAESLQP